MVLEWRQYKQALYLWLMEAMRGDGGDGGEYLLNPSMGRPAC